MKNSIRWLLTESRISSLDPNEVNFIDGKLICYHLTSHQKWASYNPDIDEKLKKPTVQNPKQERSADDSRAMRIVKNLKDSNRISRRDAYDVEEEVIMDMIDDPYTDTSGFTPGVGDHHGKGLYTCYKFNPGIARNYGDICLVFEIDISNFIITFEDLAKQVHGEDWRIKDQVTKLYKRQPRDEESLKLFSKLINRIEESELNLNQTINKMSPHTSQVSYALMKAFNKDFISSVYDGIIFLGRGDGPVCVSFFPKYDAKLIGLGRLSSRTAKAEVDWYDSLNDFLGGRARNKLDFQTMNDIAEENTSLAEKEEMKESERTFYDVKHNYVLSTLNEIMYSQETIKGLVEFYEEIKNSGSKENLEIVYREVATGRFIQHYKELDTISPEILQNWVDILEETYQLHKNSGNKHLDNFYLNIGTLLGSMPDINFSNDLLVNGVFNAHKKYFTGTNKFDPETASTFLKSAKKYIENQNSSGEFVRLIRDLENKYGIDLKIKTGNWIELIELYENGSQEVKDKIINLPEERIGRHPFKPMSLPDESGNFINVYYYKSKEKIDKFCNIIDEMIRRRNINILDSLQLAFLHVEHPLSNAVVEKCVDELITLPTNGYTKRLTAYIVNYFDKFNTENTDLLEKFNAVLKNMVKSSEKEFNKLIDNLEKKTKAQGGLLSHSNIYYDESKKLYFESQLKKWHERLVNLIIENVKSNYKFAKLKEETCRVINYSVNLKDIRISDQDMRLLLTAAGNKAYWFLDYKYMSQSVYTDILTSALQNKVSKILNAVQLSAIFFRNLYKDKQLLDAFIQYSDSGFFKRTLNRLIDPLKGNIVSLGLDAYNLYPYDTTKVSIKEVIDPNDNEWFNYLLEEVRTKTNSGKTKKAAKLFKEFDALMAQRNVNKETQKPELDLSHRKIIGNSLKEVYSF